jgi:WhiB family redox-sensing transcriptional regulator
VHIGDFRPPKNASRAFMEYGNCSDTDPETFFPERGAAQKLREALAVCTGCEVKAECLEYALEAPYEKFGVWGGTSERERRTMRTRRGVASADHGTLGRANSGCTCHACLMKIQTVRTLRSA